jgi:hypothetical protein
MQMLKSVTGWAAVLLLLATGAPAQVAFGPGRGVQRPEEEQSTSAVAARFPRSTTGLAIIPAFDTSITSNPNATAIEGAIYNAIATIQAVITDPVIRTRIRMARRCSLSGAARRRSTPSVIRSF